MHDVQRHCNPKHIPKWLVNYDIGYNKSEEILVCNECYVDPSDDCFRLYEISRVLLLEI